MLRNAIVVHPEPLTAMQISGVLERSGYAATIAQSAREALLAGVRPELAVVAVLLPDEAGPTLAKRLADAAPGLRVVFVSRLTRAEAVAAGMPSDAHFVEGPSIEPILRSLL
jgi:DNA-binding response OmpR family regulator